MPSFFHNFPFIFIIIKAMHKDVICIVSTPHNQKQIIAFDPQIANFQIGFFDLLSNQPYQIPSSILETSRPLKFMKLFLESHFYNPRSIIINRPIQLGNLVDNFDQSTYNLVKKFTQIQNFQQAQQIILFSDFIQFDILLQVVSITLLTYFSNKKGQMAIEQKSVSGIKQYELDLVDTLIEYEKMIMASQSMQKEKVYEGQLRKFCSKDYQFRIIVE